MPRAVQPALVELESADRRDIAARDVVAWCADRRPARSHLRAAEPRGVIAQPDRADPPAAQRLRGRGGQRAQRGRLRVVRSRVPGSRKDRIAAADQYDARHPASWPGSRPAGPDQGSEPRVRAEGVERGDRGGELGRRCRGEAGGRVERVEHLAGGQVGDQRSDLRAEIAGADQPVQAGRDACRRGHTAPAGRRRAGGAAQDGTRPGDARLANLRHLEQREPGRQQAGDCGARPGGEQAEQRQRQHHHPRQPVHRPLPFADAGPSTGAVTEGIHHNRGTHQGSEAIIPPGRET